MKINTDDLTLLEVYHILETQKNLYIKGLGNSQVELRTELEVITL